MADDGNAGGKIGLPERADLDTYQAIMEEHDRLPKWMRKVEREAPYRIVINVPDARHHGAKRTRSAIKAITLSSARATYGADYPADIPPVRS